jgi:hypothetical protein
VEADRHIEVLLGVVETARHLREEVLHLGQLGVTGSFCDQQGDLSLQGVPNLHQLAQGGLLHLDHPAHLLLERLHVGVEGGVLDVGAPLAVADLDQAHQAEGADRLSDRGSSDVEAFRQLSL